MAERLARIRGVVGYDGIASADLVIEAVFESLALKKEVFAEIARRARPGAVLASNTSTLDVDQLAAAAGRAESVVGLHFFSPAQVMRLVEIVRGQATSESVLVAALQLTKRLSKVGVVVRNGPGFVGNRMMFPYMYEAQFLAEEGASPEQVDRVLTDWGMAMGIFAVDDMGGLDVAWRIRKELRQFEEPGARKPLVADRLVELGRLGQKAGRGWYRYADDRKPIPDPEVLELIESVAARARIERRSISDEEILERTLYALVNEGARVLEAGIARRAADIDVIYLTGYGFPAFRGGPHVLRGLRRAAAGPRAPRHLPSRSRPALRAGAAPRAAGAGRLELPRARCSPRSGGGDDDAAMSARATAQRRIRPVSIAAADTAVRRGPDGVVYLQSRHTLGSYPSRFTERLAHWAEHAPDRAFLAQRAPSGRWRTLTYAETLAAVRRVAAGPARAEALGRAAARHPVRQLDRARASGPRRDARGRALRAARSRLFAAGARLRHAGAHRRAASSPAWCSRPRARRSSARSPPCCRAGRSSSCRPRRPRAGARRRSRSSAATPPTAAVDDAHATGRAGHDREDPLHLGLDRPAEGRRQHAAHAVLQPGDARSVLPFLAEEPPVLCDWLPWNHTAGGNHNFGLVLWNGGTLYIDEGRPLPGAFEATVRNLREISATAHFTVPRTLRDAAAVPAGGPRAARAVLRPAQALLLRRRRAHAARVRRAPGDGGRDAAARSCSG